MSVFTVSSLNAVMTIGYEVIKKATQNFSDSYKLGSGSFGTVYYMDYVDTKYAIKRLHPVGSDQKRQYFYVHLCNYT